jgi:hypothetical protein
MCGQQDTWPVLRLWLHPHKASKEAQDSPEVWVSNQNHFMGKPTLQNTFHTAEHYKLVKRRLWLSDRKPENR